MPNDFGDDILARFEQTFNRDFVRGLTRLSDDEKARVKQAMQLAGKWAVEYMTAQTHDERERIRVNLKHAEGVALSTAALVQVRAWNRIRAAILTTLDHVLSGLRRAL